MQLTHPAHSQKSHNHFPGQGRDLQFSGFIAITLSPEKKIPITAEHFLGLPTEHSPKFHTKFGFLMNTG
jgi:hypothetical protein